MRHPFVLAAVFAFAAGALVMGAFSASVGAAKPKPAYTVSFGPGQIVAGTSSALVFTLRNTGSAPGTLRLGDRLELTFGRGSAVGDLLEDGTTITTTIASPVGAALDVQDLPNAAGVQVFATGDTEIAVGDALVLVIRGTAAPQGAAEVKFASGISKKSGKAPKRLKWFVVKTPFAGEEPFYGDGSAGALVASEGAELQTLQGYTDVLIPSGVTVSVTSGATLRCTGTFENRGTIVVGPGGAGGGTQLDNPSGQPLVLQQQLQAAEVPWGRGDARARAGRPAVMERQDVLGAVGGVGLDDAVYSLPLSSYRHGGGGGSAALGGLGGDGGGLLRILARGPIYNGGTIRAAGTASAKVRDAAPGAGSGGGAGGIVILASATSVDNAAPTNANGNAASGVIDVRGASGGTPDYLGGGGGGGGGGLVVFVAPLVRDLELSGPQGTTLLDPGLNASGTILGTEWSAQVGPPRLFSGGGGGGACVGNGGGGTGVQANGDIGPPPDPALPERGQTIERRADPRTLWN